MKKIKTIKTLEKYVIKRMIENNVTEEICCIIESCFSYEESKIFLNKCNELINLNSKEDKRVLMHYISKYGRDSAEKYYLQWLFTDMIWINYFYGKKYTLKQYIKVLSY